MIVIKTAEIFSPKCAEKPLPLGMGRKGAILSFFFLSSMI